MTIPCTFIRAPEHWVCTKCGRSIRVRKDRPPHSICQVKSIEECVHQKSLIRLETCGTCTGKTRVKVFACEVHGECTIGKVLAGIHCCSGCQDRVIPSPPSVTTP